MRSAVVRHASAGHDDLEPAEVAARIAVLAAVVEPENAEGEDAVDDGGGFCGADADDRVGGGSVEQAAANVGGAEAVLEIHGRAQAVDLGADEMAREHALEQALVVAAGGVAGGGRAAVAGGHEFERLRLGRAHAARDEAQALRALLHVDDGAHEVALVAPELEQAAAVRLGDGVARGAHVEEDAAVFKERGCGVIGEIGFDWPAVSCAGARVELGDAGTPSDGLLSMGWSAGGHDALYQPMRSRRLVMWATWWRECQS